MIDLSTVIGVYTRHTETVLVYQMDDEEDWVLASSNGVDPKWCEIQDADGTGELEPGFYLGSVFVPFVDVMKSGAGEIIDFKSCFSCFIGNYGNETTCQKAHQN